MASWKAKTEAKELPKTNQKSKGREPIVETKVGLIIEIKNKYIGTRIDDGACRYDKLNFREIYHLPE